MGPQRPVWIFTTQTGWELLSQYLSCTFSQASSPSHYRLSLFRIYLFKQNSLRWWKINDLTLTLLYICLKDSWWIHDKQQFNCGKDNPSWLRARRLNINQWVTAACPREASWEQLKSSHLFKYIEWINWINVNSGSVLIYIRARGGITVAGSLVHGGQCAVHDWDKTWTVLNTIGRP